MVICAKQAHSIDNRQSGSKQRPPRPNARYHDLSTHDFDSAPNEGASTDPVQTIPNPTGFLDQVAILLQNDALTVLELCDAMAESSPFRLWLAHIQRSLSPHSFGCGARNAVTIMSYKFEIHLNEAAGEAA